MARTKRGRASTYGNYPGKYRDPGDNNIPALPGASNNYPGIAIYNRGTLGGYYRVIPPRSVSRRTAVVQHTDIGPHPKTGRLVDVNAVAARRLFGLPYGNSFPTDRGVWTIMYLGKRKPPGLPRGGGIEEQLGRKVAAAAPAAAVGGLMMRGGGDRLASVLQTLSRLNDAGEPFQSRGFSPPIGTEPPLSEEEMLMRAARRRLG